jgi:hypothetical protein
MTIFSFILRYLPVILALGTLQLAVFIDGSRPRFEDLRFIAILLAYAMFAVFIIGEIMRVGGQNARTKLPVIIIGIVAIATIGLNLGLINKALFKSGNYPLKGYGNLRLEQLAKDDPQRQIRNLAHTMYRMRPYLRDALIWVPQSSPIGFSYWRQYARAGMVKTYQPGKAPKTINIEAQQGEQLQINDKRSLLFFSRNKARAYVLEKIDNAGTQFRLLPVVEKSQ